MHEISIAQSLLTVVLQTIPREKWKEVDAIRVRVGDCSGVVCDSLEFSFNALAADSPLARARLEIDRIPFRVRCNHCGEEREDERGIAICLHCGSTDTEILSGAELELREIVLCETVPESS